jgi:hypothetical protein
MCSTQDGALLLCDLPDSYLQQLCASLPKHLQQRLRCTCRKLQQLIDAAVGLKLCLNQSRASALQRPRVAQHLTALDITSFAAYDDLPDLQAANRAIAAQLKQAFQLPRLSR